MIYLVSRYDEVDKWQQYHDSTNLLIVVNIRAHLETVSI